MNKMQIETYVYYIFYCYHKTHNKQLSKSYLSNKQHTWTHGNTYTAGAHFTDDFSITI